ncbi:MAG: hypothetical protein ACRD2E_00600 [Terriglobales bacterium]
MRAPGESISKAKSDTESFINSAESSARADQAAGDNQKAMTDFGRAVHAISDETSPMHRDGQGNPIEWHNPIEHPILAKEHSDGERHITPAQLAAAVSAVQTAYGKTFGADALKQASTPKSKLPDHQ